VGRREEYKKKARKRKVLIQYCVELFAEGKLRAEMFVSE
jgi:hypothetical protein